MQNMKIILVRHGETIENKEKSILGHLPGHLSHKGKIQAKQVAKRLKKDEIDYCFSSDLKRAADTAKEILNYHPETKVVFTKQIRELCLGEMQGKSREDYNWPEFWKRLSRGWKPKSGELKKHFEYRVKNFWKKLSKDRRFRNKTILVVSHDGTLKKLFILILKKKREEVYQTHQKNTAVTIIDIKNRKKNLISYNCTAHFCYRIK